MNTRWRAGAGELFLSWLPAGPSPEPAIWADTWKLTLRAATPALPEVVLRVALTSSHAVVHDGCHDAVHDGSHAVVRSDCHSVALDGSHDAVQYALPLPLLQVYRAHDLTFRDHWRRGHSRSMCGRWMRGHSARGRSLRGHWFHDHWLLGRGHLFPGGVFHANGARLRARVPAGRLR